MQRLDLTEQVSKRQQAAIEDLLWRLATQYPGQIARAVLFGSVARGEATADSDIDILLVINNVDWQFKWEARGTAARVSLEHDVLFNLHIYSHTRWAEEAHEQSALWRNVQRDGIDFVPYLTT